MFDYREYVEAQREVPAVKCANDHQKAVFTNCYYAACDIIGSNENTLSDYDPDSEEYKYSEAYLKDHAALVNDILYEGTHNEYGCGFSGPGHESQKHYRFAGKAFTEKAVEEIVKAMGY